MTRRCFAASAAFAVGGAIVVAQLGQETFRVERPIVVAGAGQYRLAVDAALLSSAAPFSVVMQPSSAGDPVPVAVDGLSDLRLFDGSNREVPYLLVRAANGDAKWVQAVLHPVASTKTTSGFEADFGAPTPIDRVSLSGLRAPFLKRLVVEGSGDRQHWTLLASEATLFDLPDERLRQLDVPFNADRFQDVRVTWDDRNTGRVALPAAVFARRVLAVAPTPPATTTLAVEPRPSEPGISRYQVRLPGTRLPIAALVLNVGPGHVHRDATVSEPRLQGLEAMPQVLGRALLTRVTMGDLAADGLRIPITAPIESELDLAIDDGDNPPLALSGVTAEFAELPWIYFQSDGSPIVARYGRAGSARPRYDLEAARDSVRLERAREAHWASPNTAPDTPSVAAPIPTAGASIDAGAFRHARALPAGSGGLVTVPLDAAVLAQSAGPERGFADVRVVDDSGRQIPYLLERRLERTELPVALEPTTSSAVDRMSGRGAGRRPLSVYRARLPFATLPALQLVLATDARVFDRGITIGVERPPDRRAREPWIEQLASVRWVHGDRERTAAPLALSIAGRAGADLLVIVDEGDNAPLPLSTARVLLPSYRLRFYRPASAGLRLVYGRDDLTPPRYDLALLAPQVLGVAATEIAAAPDAGAPATPAARGVNSPVVFWSVLVAAVLILVGVVVRLLKTPRPET